MRNGQSWFDSKRVRIRSYPVAVERGDELQKGPYVAETFPVHVEDSYVIVEGLNRHCRLRFERKCDMALALSEAETSFVETIPA